MNEFFIRANIANWDVDEVKAPSLREALLAHAAELEREAENRETEMLSFRKHAARARAVAAFLLSEDP